MKYALVALMLVITSLVFAKDKTKAKAKSPRSSPAQVIGVLVNRKKLPNDERTFLENLSQYRWTVHQKGLQLNSAPKDSVIYDVGLRLGDVVAAVNDHQMDGAAAIFNGIKSVREENHCKLLVYRDNKLIQFNVSAK